MKINFDVDIDMADRDKFLELVDNIPASIKRDGEFEKHNTGVYFQPIPSFPLEEFSTIDHKDAEEFAQHVQQHHRMVMNEYAQEYQKIV